MKLSRKISVVAATFFLAAATGQYMQSTTARHTRASQPTVIQLAEPRVAAKVVPVSAPVSASMALPAMPRLAAGLPPALRAPTVAAPHAEADAPVGPLPDGAPTPAPLAVAATCAAPTASLDVGAGAMLELKLSAPCHASERVVIRHAGLAFTALTGTDGKLHLKLPAMNEAADVAVMFQGGETVSASASVPELSLYDRVAVQWIGNDSFALHGLEFGAAFGQPGDISAANPGAPAEGVAKAGFLTSLGDGSVDLPMRAEVYTFPTRLSDRAGKVHFVIDAAVSKATCGRDMLAETLRTRPNADPVSADLTVAMPECDTSGGFVELDGLMPDISVAAN